MAVAPTYPGVYIEEIPSGVHTITGVATSITAFVGYTARGNVDRAVHIFSFADFERGFGGLAVDSSLSYAVKHFFQNGGTEAYVVRVANGAAPATVTLRHTAGPILIATANGAGTWGNNLQLDVDYDTSNPASYFNLRVTEFVEVNGQLQPARSEAFRNLSLNDKDPSYAVNAVNSSSELIQLAKTGALVAGKGSSVSGAISGPELTAFGALTSRKIRFTLNGLGPYEIDLGSNTTTATIITDLKTKIEAKTTPNTVTVASTASSITVTSDDPSAQSSIHFLNAATSNVAGLLHLGLANGGTETDGVAGSRPLPTGTTAVVTMSGVTGVTGTLTIDVKRGAATAKTVTLPLWGATPLPPLPTTLDDLVLAIRSAIASAVTASPPETYLIGAVVRRVGGALQIVPGPGDPNISFDFTPTAPPALLTALNLTAANARNVARYAPGTGTTQLAQMQGAMGGNGTLPLESDLQGSQLLKTGMYALEDVDLFNLLVMPDTTKGSGMFGALSEAIAYCERRRAFMIIDVPDSVSDFVKAQTWIGSQAGPLRSRNSALYFPRIREPDPLMNNIVGSFPAAGAIAGVYARTDSERGVWKAPAGTAATLEGVVDLSYVLTDSENGTLNPVALNCLRQFPIYGAVVWGARTGNGADAMADEYKYIPVRRLALFLEESLFRGTQWVVFEPNDEPLWAQIRLNLGAFMHTLFAQGAFAGRTPREAYFVKCDKDTTTQNDIDLGRVNIVVGFAPLKPAEFVIIKIQQIVRDLQV